MVIQGFREDCLPPNGADFKYNSNVARLTAILYVIFDPITLKPDGNLNHEDVTLSSIGIAYAYLQSGMLPPNVHIAEVPEGP